MEFDKDLRSIQEVRDLLTQARRAQNALAAMSQEDLDRITAAISAAGAEHAARLAAMAAEETGFGKKEDKEIKNRFAAGMRPSGTRRPTASSMRTENTGRWISGCRWG